MLQLYSIVLILPLIAMGPISKYVVVVFECYYPPPLLLLIANLGVKMNPN